MGTVVQARAKYAVGQVVRHRIFQFRGVIFDIDPEFDNTEEWWLSIPEEIRPHKEQPYYHLLAENSETEYIAYVSEQNLIPDDTGQPLNASANRYVLHFEPGKLPPAHAFWSVTMYDLPANLMVDNPLDRYLINSPMLPDLKREADGGLNIYVQKDSPGKDKESNWLPAPNGPFWMAMRIYWPKVEALNGTWKQPPLRRAK